MSSLADWDITCNSSVKTYGSNEFLRVKPGCKLKVRLLGRPVKVVKVFCEDRKRIVLDNEDVGNQLKKKYPKKISNVSIRYACWCISREDNTMRILDMPTSVARGFGNRVTLIGKKISTVNEGCDWAIVTNGKKGKDVRYDAYYLEETPLSDEEKEMVKCKMEDEDSFDLTKVFESYSFEEAEEKLISM